MKTLLATTLLMLSVSCHKQEAVQETAPPPAAPATETQAAAPAPAPPAPAQTTTTLAAGAPIPASGVLLWLVADDAPAGKLQSWTNKLVPNVSATAVHNEQLPMVVPNAINGHAVVRFDGTDQMLLCNVDIGPTRMPEGTIVTVFRSATAAPSPLRKLYGDDNGGYDRVAGLDDRADRNYTVFIGTGVAPYFALEANTTYLAVDEYSPKEFSGWIDGNPRLVKHAADWGDDALPNLYLGGTGTVYSEYWNGDLAEIIVYARKLSEAERMQIEDYLAAKYAVTMTRQLPR